MTITAFTVDLQQFAVVNSNAAPKPKVYLPTKGYKQPKRLSTPAPTAVKPLIKHPIKQPILNNSPMLNMNPSMDPFNMSMMNQYKSQSASVQDIGKKYGIDYSREYAQRQAQAEAQAKQASLDAQKNNVNTGVKNAQDALDRNYFQKGLEQAQAGVNGGINAGLQNEANLRLGMNRQAETADVFRQAQTEQFRIAQESQATEQARVAKEEQIYQDRLAQAIQLINENRQLDSNEKQMMLQAALQMRGQNIDMSQFGQTMDWNRYQYGHMSAAERAGLDWNKYQFNNMSATDKAGLSWNKYQFNNLSAADQQANKLAWARLDQEKQQFGSEQAWRKYQYTHMSATDQMTLNENRRQFGEDMAWKNYEMTYTSEMALAQTQAEAGGYAGDLAGIP